MTYPPLDHANLLARLCYFDPDVGVPITILTATAAAALPQRSPTEDIATVQELLDDLEEQGLVVYDKDEPIIRLTLAGQTAAAAVPEALRRAAADPVERVMTEWYAMVEAEDVGDLSASAVRLLAHTAIVADHAAARGDHRIVLGMRMYHGQLALPLGDIDAAEEDSVLALAAAERMREHRDLALMAAHDLAGRVALYRGHLEAAEQHARAALAHLPAERSAHDFAGRVAKLAGTLVEQGRYRDAVALMEPLIPQLRQGPLTPPPDDAAHLLRCYGTSLVAVGQQQEGLATLQEAVELLERTGDDTELAGALDDLATGQALAGQAEAAVATFERMLAVVQETEIFGPQLAQHLNNFAGALRTAGDLQRAQKLLQRAQAVARLTHADPDFVAMVERNIADLAAQLGGERVGETLLINDRSNTLLQPLRTVVTVLVSGAWVLIDDALLELGNHDADTDTLLLLEHLMELAAGAATTAAIQALHAHILDHHTLYEALGVSLFAFPRPLSEGGHTSDHAIFSEQTLRDEEGDVSFAEEVRAVALRGVLMRMHDELAERQGLAGHILAPTDTFFSAVDRSPTISEATWAALEADPAPFMLIDVDLLTLPYPLPTRVELLAADDNMWDNEGDADDEWDEEDEGGMDGNEEAR